MSDFCRNCRCVIVRCSVTLLTLGSCFHGPVGVGKSKVNSIAEEADSFAIWEHTLFDDPTNDELARKVFSHDTVFTNRFWQISDGGNQRTDIIQNGCWVIDVEWRDGR